MPWPSPGSSARARTWEATRWVFNEGDVLRPKIGNVRLLSRPVDGGDAIATLARDGALIFLGQEQDGFLQVERARGGGWVKQILVTR